MELNLSTSMGEGQSKVWSDSSRKEDRTWKMLEKHTLQYKEQRINYNLTLTTPLADIYDAYTWWVM